MSFTLISDTEDDNRPHLNVASLQRKRPYCGSRENPIQIVEDKAAEAPRKKQCHSSHIGGPVNLSKLPFEIRIQIMSEIPDRRTLLNVCLLSRAFRDIFNMRKWDFVISAYTEEVRQGQHTSANAISTIARHIKGNPKPTLVLFKVAWKGIFSAGRLKDAVSFLHRLGDGLNSQDFGIVLRSLRTMYDQVDLEVSWEAWAAAFTATDFLREEYGTSNIINMQQWIHHQAVSRRREIMGQSLSKVQWNNAYYVSKQLQSYLKRKKLNDELVEVIQATLDLAVQEHQWHDASLEIFELVELDANVYSLVRILESICSGAILENRWQDATEAVNMFKNIPDYANVGKESLSTIRSMCGMGPKE